MVKAVTAVLFAATFIYVVIMVGFGNGKTILILSEYVSWVFLISVCPLSVIGIIAFIRFIRKRSPKLPPFLPPEYLYALTNLRAIIYSVPYLSTTSVALEEVEVVLESLNRGYGQFKFYPYSKKLAPVWNTFPQKTPLSSIQFQFVPDSAELYRLMRSTQSKLRADNVKH